MYTKISDNKYESREYYCMKKRSTREKTTTILLVAGR
jgi:hypothetical protein